MAELRLFPDTLFYDKKKRRVGAVKAAEPMMEVAAISWNDGTFQQVTKKQLNQKGCRHFRSIRLRDFPLRFTYKGIELPGRIRKDDYILDKHICHFIRLLDLIALAEVKEDAIKDSVYAFLPDKVDHFLSFTSFKEIPKEQFQVSVTVDRVMPIILRVKLSALFSV